MRGSDQLGDGGGRRGHAAREGERGHHHGGNTRITTVSSSQIKLFIQINDLETSEFVSEMLGETTQVYKKPIQRPGQGTPRV